MARFKDIADSPEDDRIDQIGRAAMAGQVVAFITDADPDKADRYIAKLKARFPQLQVVGRGDGPVPNTITVKVSLPKG